MAKAYWIESDQAVRLSRHAAPFTTRAQPHTIVNMHMLMFISARVPMQLIGSMVDLSEAISAEHARHAIPT